MQPPPANSAHHRESLRIIQRQGTCTLFFLFSQFPNQVAIVFLLFYLYIVAMQTITRYDVEVMNLHDKRRFRDVTFDLFDKNGAKKEYSCPYYICDGGCGDNFHFCWYCHY